MQMIYPPLWQKGCVVGDLQKWSCQMFRVLYLVINDLDAETRGPEFLQPTQAHGFTTVLRRLFKPL